MRITVVKEDLTPSLHSLRMLVQVNEERPEYFNGFVVARPLVAHPRVEKQEDDGNSRSVKARHGPPFGEFLEGGESMLAINRHSEHLIAIPSHASTPEALILRGAPRIPETKGDRADLEGLAKRLVIHQDRGRPIDVTIELVYKLGTFLIKWQQGNGDGVEELRHFRVPQVRDNLSLHPRPVDITLIQLVNAPGDLFCTGDLTRQPEIRRRLLKAQRGGKIWNFPFGKIEAPIQKVEMRRGGNIMN